MCMLCAAAVYKSENLIKHVLVAIPRGLGREAWLQALPRTFVAGFVKTDKNFQSRGETTGTTATFVMVDGWTVTVASVGDSRCILDTHGGAVSTLTVDYTLEEHGEEREHVAASGGEVGRLRIVGGAEQSCRGLPAELAARQVVKEALRSRGLKDDTTCIVVDIIPPDATEQPSTPPKKINKLRTLLWLLESLK